MNKKANDELRKLIKIFLEGDDRSIALANQIEGLIINEYYDADFYDDLVLSLSLYQPGGGEYLDDEEVLSQELRLALAKLDCLDNKI